MSFRTVGLAAVFVAGLAACRGQPGDESMKVEPPAAPSSETLAASVDGAFRGVVDNAGLETVLDGVGPYTLLAPTDAAMSANAQAGELNQEALRAQAVALARAHILPGALTRQDIAAAVARAGADGAQVRTMADTLVTFRQDGDTLTVTTPDGATARLTGEETLASNGVIQPVDAVLERAAPTA